MKKVVLTMCVCGLLAGTAWAVPYPVFISPGPGLNAPLDTDAAAVTYGHYYGGATVSFDGDSGSASEHAYMRHETTLENETSVTAMPEDQDWVFEIVLKQTDGYNADAIFYSKHERTGDSEDRMVMLSCNGTTDDWSWKVGNAVGGWDVVVSGISLGSDWNTFTTHYKADTQTLDTYQNGIKIASNYTTGHGAYDIDSLQWQWIGAGTSWVRSIKIGQIPEPATLALLSLGGLGLLRRRRA